MEGHCKVLVVALIFLLQYTSVLSGVSKRNVKTIPWPDCDDYVSCKTAKNESVLPNIVYVKASTDKHDVLHYVFSTYELPTVLVAYTIGADANMKFNWDHLLNKSSIANAISIKGGSFKILNQMALVLTKLIEYDDTDDDANLEDYAKKKKKDQKWNVMDFSDMTWVQLFDVKGSGFSFSTHNNDNGTVGNRTNDGNVTLAFRVPHNDGRDSLLPSLKFTSNETLFDFILNHFTPSFDKSRFAVEVVAFSQSAAKNMSIEQTSSIDDEYSPGVFRVIDWYMDRSHKTTRGYIQWKPVCYLDKGRGRDKATKVKSYKLQNLDERPDNRLMINNSLVYGLFGEKLWEEDMFLIRSTNISFGLTKDGFYVGTNYTVWTGAIGYGTPPVDGISMTVIIIIACGLGLPVLIIIVGGIYLIMKKVRRKSEGYSPISSVVSANSPQVN